MKILHIMNYYQENMGYQENWLPYYQKQLGNEVLILASDKYFPFPNYDINMKSILGDRHKGEGLYDDKGIKVVRKKSLFEITSKSIIYFHVKEIILDFKPDIIHLHGITNINLFQLIYFMPKYNTKLFIDSHTDYQVSNYKSMLNQVYYKLWNIAYKIIDKRIKLFLPTTKEAHRFLTNEFNIKNNRIKINYLGVNINNFYFDESAKLRLSQQYNLEGKIVIINAGKQYEGKKIDFIIQIVKDLIKKFNRQEVILMLIGQASDSYENVIINEMKNIEDNIIRIPFVENKLLKDYYSLADIGIWPGIPSNTIQEAMACEVALVLPNNDTTSHLIENNGFVFDKFDSLKVADKINEIFKSDLLDQYKYNSRKNIKKYSWEQIAKESLGIYEKY
jgi:hypothetical protein